VLASGNEECLFGTEATFLDGGADLVPQLGGGVSKTSANTFSIHIVSFFHGGATAAPHCALADAARTATRISS